MKRVRIGIIGAGAVTEWGLLPLLSGPDAVAPPDTGAWWGRRPLTNTEIQYQAPARPEVVALADIDGARAERVAFSWRVRAHYDNWRLMLKEVELDALFCLAPPDVSADIILAAGKSVKWLWVDGPPAPNAVSARQLADKMSGRPGFVWCAHPVRHAAGHRAAKRLVEKGNIGPLSALSLRWGLPFHSATPDKTAGRTADAAPYLASSYAAFDFLLPFAAWQRGMRGLCGRVTGAESSGSTNLLLHLDRGVSATALFSGSDNWSSSLPRLEACGTQGRSLICEAGRRLWVHEPRESARFLEPPGLASYISAANVAGLAEDVKAFLAAVAGQEPVSDGHIQTETSGLAEAAQILGCLEAAGEAVATDRMIEWGPVPSAATSPAKKPKIELVTDGPRTSWPSRNNIDSIFPDEAAEDTLTLPL